MPTDNDEAGHHRACADMLSGLMTSWRYGMPTGNDEADLAWDTITGKATELPFISIAAEMWRGFRDCGEALTAVGRATGSKAASDAGASMSAEAAPLLSDLHTSMAKDAFGPTGSPRCFPYVAGVAECGELPTASAPSDRDSEPWRTCVRKRRVSCTG